MPASAVTYTGKLYGTITSGGAGSIGYPGENPPEEESQDLAGTPIEIDFINDVIGTFQDPNTGEILSNYITTDVVIKTNAMFFLGVLGEFDNKIRTITLMDHG